MIKVIITHMKAPWPTGSKPGDIVELPALAIPGWAAGKCKQAPDDAKVTVKPEASQRGKGSAAPDDAKTGQA